MCSMTERTVVFLRCRLEAGQFSGEHSVTVSTRKGPVSFFADRRLVKESGGQAYVRVSLSRNEADSDWRRVVLPQEPFETGNPLVEVNRELVADKL